MSMCLYQIYVMWKDAHCEYMSMWIVTSKPKPFKLELRNFLKQF